MFDDVTMTTTGNLFVADDNSVNQCNLQVYSHINYEANDSFCNTQVIKTEAGTLDV